MRDGVVVEQAVVSEPAVLEGTLDRVGMIRLIPVGEIPDAGRVFGAEDHHDLRLPRGDDTGELGDQMLGALPADGLEDRACRRGADALGHRPRVVVGLAHRRGGAPGDLELPEGGDGVDGRGDGGDVGPGVM